MSEVLFTLFEDEEEATVLRLYYEVLDFPKLDLYEVRFEGSKSDAGTLLPLEVFNQKTLDSFYRACEEDCAESIMAEADDRAQQVLEARAEDRVDEQLQEGQR